MDPNREALHHASRQRHPERALVKSEPQRRRRRADRDRHRGRHQQRIVAQAAAADRAHAGVVHAADRQSHRHRSAGNAEASQPVLADHIETGCGSKDRKADREDRLDDVIVDKHGELDGSLRLLPLPHTEDLGQAYSPSAFHSADYPSLIPDRRTVETVSVRAVLVANNVPRNGEAYRRIAKFVPVFFSALSELAGPQ